MPPYNGSGTFAVYTPGNPVVTNTTISSTVQNNTNNDFATGLSTALTKDGQTTPTANIPMGGFRITSVGAPSATGDALSEGRAIGGTTPAVGTFLTVRSASSVTAITATATPVTLFTPSANSSGLYLVNAYITNAGAANYTAAAWLLFDGTNARLVTISNGALLTITLSGTDVQATQTSGSNQVISYSYIYQG